MPHSNSHLQHLKPRQLQAHCLHPPGLCRTCQMSRHSASSCSLSSCNPLESSSTRPNSATVLWHQTAASLQQHRPLAAGLQCLGGKALALPFPPSSRPAVPRWQGTSTSLPESQILQCTGQHCSAAKPRPASGCHQTYFMQQLGGKVQQLNTTPPVGCAAN